MFHVFYFRGLKNVKHMTKMKQEGTAAIGGDYCNIFYRIILKNFQLDNIGRRWVCPSGLIFSCTPLMCTIHITLCIPSCTPRKLKPDAADGRRDTRAQFRLLAPRDDHGPRVRRNFPHNRLVPNHLGNGRNERKINRNGPGWG